MNAEYEHKPSAVKKIFPLLNPPGKAILYGDYRDPSLSHKGQPRISSGGLEYTATMRSGDVESYRVTLPAEVIGSGKKAITTLMEESSPEDAQDASRQLYEISSLHAVELTKEKGSDENTERSVKFGNAEHVYCTITPEGILLYPNGAVIREVQDENGYKFEVLLSTPIQTTPNTEDNLRIAVGIHLNAQTSFNSLLGPIEAQLRSGYASEEYIRSQVNCVFRLMTPGDPLLPEFVPYSDQQDSTHPIE
jgi:hypothetical protein